MNVPIDLGHSYELQYTNHQKSFYFVHINLQNHFAISHKDPVNIILWLRLKGESHPSNIEHCQTHQERGIVGHSHNIWLTGEKQGPGTLVTKHETTSMQWAQLTPHPLREGKRELVSSVTLLGQIFTSTLFQCYALKDSINRKYNLND